MAVVSVVARAVIVMGCIWLCSSVPRKKAVMALAGQAGSASAVQAGCASR
jgi:hypothetical protein